MADEVEERKVYVEKDSASESSNNKSSMIAALVSVIVILLIIWLVFFVIQPFDNGDDDLGEPINNAVPTETTEQ